MNNIIHEFYVDGMHCNACVNRIKNALLQNSNIKKVDILLDKRKVIIETNENMIQSDMTQSELKLMIENAGYNVIA